MVAKVSGWLTPEEIRRRDLVWAGSASSDEAEPVQGGEVVALCVPFPEGTPDAHLSVFVESSAGVVGVGQASVALNLGITSIERVPKCPDQ